ncbi:hypothetical protein C4F50_24590 [Flavobacterium sp. KB82]|uniref:Lipoprotein n=1 Tax=Flavobacterium hungaricum TaxID=2082725 RepID=A0ABR9TTI4_9FLAO|nr:hypothetical protein [Flavobacterium hungaricum]
MFGSENKKMKNILYLILFFSIAGCNKKIENENTAESKEQKIETFWNWFIENEKRFRNPEIDLDEVLQEILDNASAIEKELAFEIKPIKNGIISLTISADGVKQLIPTVQKMIEKSPKIKGWKFIAFRQKKDKKLFTDIIYLSDQIELEPSKMQFLPIVENGSLELIIYSTGINEENYNEIFYGGSLLLDNLVGEYKFMTQVDNYDFHNMPTKKEDLNQLRPLSELPAFIDNHEAKK